MNTRQQLNLYCMSVGFRLDDFLAWLEGLDDSETKRELAEDIEYAQQQVMDGQEATLRTFLMGLYRRKAETEAQLMRPLATIGEAHSKAQSEKALQRWAHRRNVNDLIEGLAGSRDALGDWTPASELWDSLWSELDGFDLNPQEHGNGVEKRYTFDGGDVSYETFRKHLSRTRKEWEQAK